MTETITVRHTSTGVYAHVAKETLDTLIESGWKAATPPKGRKASTPTSE